MNADTMLSDAVRNGNKDGLMQVFVLHAPALYKYAYRLSHDSVVADRIVGEVFTKLLEHISAGRGPALNMRSNLFEIAYHLVVDEGHYPPRRAPREAPDLALSDGYTFHINGENRILFETVRRAIATDLTPDQRHVIILRFLEGFSVKETALIIGKTVVNVKVIQNRAIAALRRALDDQVMDTGDITLMIRNLSRTYGG